MKPFSLVSLGRSALRVTPICLGTMTFGEQVDAATSHAILDRAMERGLSFMDIAEMYAVPVCSPRTAHGLVNRVVDNGLDEAMHGLGVSLLAYSPLGFGSLTGTYDDAGFTGGQAVDRMTRLEVFRKQRWGRPEVLAAARRYSDPAQ